MRLISVDPGVTGAVAVFDLGNLVELHDMPVNDGVSAAGVAQLVHQLRPDRAVVERLQAMPGNGSIASYKSGRGMGILEGVLAARLVPVELVRPARWKRDLRLSSDKGRSRARACELFPQHAGLFGRVKDDGRAEAALIGWWWCETHPTR